MFLEGEWARSVELYTEALNIAEYAESEDILIPQEIKEKLHANRAASYLNIVRICVCLHVYRYTTLISKDAFNCLIVTVVIHEVTKDFCFK